MSTRPLSPPCILSCRPVPTGRLSQDEREATQQLLCFPQRRAAMLEASPGPASSTPWTSLETVWPPVYLAK